MGERERAKFSPPKFMIQEVGGVGKRAKHPALIKHFKSYNEAAGRQGFDHRCDYIYSFLKKKLNFIEQGAVVVVVVAAVNPGGRRSSQLLPLCHPMYLSLYPPMLFPTQKKNPAKKCTHK